MSLVGTLAIKPLLIASGVLLLGNVGQGIGLYVQSARHAAVVADKDRIASEWRTDAARLRADLTDAIGANQYSLTAIEKLEGELRAAQDQVATIRQQATAAAAIEREGRRAAESKLKSYKAKYDAQATQPDCARALTALEGACPALSGF